MQDKKYPFLDFDARRILEDFLELIKLPKIKCPKEVSRIDDKKKNITNIIDLLVTLLNNVLFWKIKYYVKLTQQGNIDLEDVTTLTSYQELLNFVAKKSSLLIQFNLGHLTLLKYWTSYDQCLLKFPTAYKNLLWYVYKKELFIKSWNHLYIKKKYELL